MNSGRCFTIQALLPELLDHRDDKRMIEFGIGLTDLVKRPTRGVDELRREEFAEGRILLAQKLEQYAPQVIAFNGKIAYEVFHNGRANWGFRRSVWYGALVFVLPSTSGKNAIGRSAKRASSASLPNCSRNWRKRRTKGAAAERNNLKCPLRPWTEFRA